jgi:LuxR family maltose regulon positive regulatory protein
MSASRSRAVQQRPAIVKELRVVRPAAAPGQQFVAKLAAPRAVEILRRHRVNDLIESSLRSGICWVAAPAGYGKTTAVVDFIESSGTPHLWFRVDEGDRDIARFFHYLTAALDGHEAPSAMPVFGVEYAEHPLEFARRYIRAFFSRLAAETVLVLDDIHWADTPEFNRVLRVILTELPPALHCICISRTLPPEPLNDSGLGRRLELIEQSAQRSVEASSIRFPPRSKILS